jgi:hypothetical protein
MKVVRNMGMRTGKDKGKEVVLECQASVSFLVEVLRIDLCQK